MYPYMRIIYKERYSDAPRHRLQHLRRLTGGRTQSVRGHPLGIFYEPI